MTVCEGDRRCGWRALESVGRDGRFVRTLECLRICLECEGL